MTFRAWACCFTGASDPFSREAPLSAPSEHGVAACTTHKAVSSTGHTDSTSKDTLSQQDSPDALHFSDGALEVAVQLLFDDTPEKPQATRDPCPPTLTASASPEAATAASSQASATHLPQSARQQEEEGQHGDGAAASSPHAHTPARSPLHRNLTPALNPTSPSAAAAALRQQQRSMYGLPPSSSNRLQQLDPTPEVPEESPTSRRGTGSAAEQAFAPAFTDFASGPLGRFGVAGPSIAGGSSHRTFHNGHLAAVLPTSGPTAGDLSEAFLAAASSPPDSTAGAPQVFPRLPLPNLPTSSSIGTALSAAFASAPSRRGPPRRAASSNLAATTNQHTPPRSQLASPRMWHAAELDQEDIEALNSPLTRSILRHELRISSAGLAGAARLGEELPEVDGSGGDGLWHVGGAAPPASNPAPDLRLFRQASNAGSAAGRSTSGACSGSVLGPSLARTSSALHPLAGAVAAAAASQRLQRPSLGPLPSRSVMQPQMQVQGGAGFGAPSSHPRRRGVRVSVSLSDHLLRPRVAAAAEAAAAAAGVTAFVAGPAGAPAVVRSRQASAAGNAPPSAYASACGSPSVSASFAGAGGSRAASGIGAGELCRRSSALFSGLLAPLVSPRRAVTGSLSGAPPPIVTSPAAPPGSPAGPQGSHVRSPKGAGPSHSGKLRLLDPALAYALNARQGSVLGAGAGGGLPLSRSVTGPLAGM